jgi:hypothetical protein
MITEDRARLAEQCEELEKKNLAARARIKVLEADRLLIDLLQYLFFTYFCFNISHLSTFEYSVKHREQLKTLLEKSDSDDQLIDALKKEVELMRNHIRRVTLEAKTGKEAEATAGRRSMKYISTYCVDDSIRLQYYH